MMLLHDFTPPRDCVGASIVGIVTLSAYFIQHLIDVSSRHFAEALDIPLYNTSIYFSKLYSSRSLSTGLGALFHYLIAVTLGVNVKTSSFIALLFLVFTRMVLIMTLSSTYIVSVEVYKVLNFDAFVLGFFQMTHFRTIWRYLFVRSIFVDLGRFVVFVIQALLDLCLKHRPLVMIRVQCWISFVITLIAACLWFFYIYYFKTAYPESKPKESIISKTTKEDVSTDLNKFKCKYFKKYEYRRHAAVVPRTGCRFKEYSIGNVSVFLMFMTASLVRNFLFPGVLPYSVLSRGKCHSVNMVLPVVSIVPPCVLFVFYSECTDLCKKSYWVRNLFWIFMIPQLISLIYALYTVHRKVLFNTEFSGSHVTVFLTTSLLMFSYGFIESMAINHYQMAINPSESLITYHYIVSTFYSFLFSRLSVGYNCARVEYDYCLTPFYPTYKKGAASSITFWIRDVLRRAYNDVEKRKSTKNDRGRSSKKEGAIKCPQKQTQGH
ncbi:conserved hypothetical protein [Theileria orientalis strain Shintoku]|uniref:Uncharacterized protein n=1 Tax=Theileria orientalis strain Shintoku TaxID=869250 RepID=J4DQ60_THEOR|nr:conserved hypothetical protein [Theileria orientalis strain Shintoku]BAM41889.1 conserved hypothetical protein [Theileria orientalis strain Shintoku]|eukprot:XP_009692190.1 conserved hypothetical protein [Theileria orientalis strain Shintoku]